MECEGEMGKSVVSAGDDFTVETALEDLEFGFSITTSTQKVSHSCVLQWLKSNLPCVC